ncbi:MAG: electron transport complex subunit RsxA [Gammaproteobacteria bacterium]|nr:electron transport complex subunit RsxA [Gammaproteobacteria bacterium]
MSDFILIIFSAALVNNIIVEKVIGTDPALAFIRKMDIAIGMSITMIILLPLATICAYIIDTFLLIPLDLQYLNLLVLVSVILLVAWGIKLWAHRMNGKITERINIFLPLAGINATALGTLLFNQQLTHGMFTSLAFGLGSALGFSIILLMLTACSERLEASDVPVLFRGVSITLITLALISMAFLGFTGLINAR